MTYNLLNVVGIGIAILLIGSTSSIFAQTIDKNQTSGQANSSDISVQENSTTQQVLDTVSNMSNVTTPEGGANTYR
ncbi:hypothetical protein [Candidatus Nitrosocosmicus franklandus]|uniref:Uncharacterized protein n=1 Tax=Candidatus Nitrosocosmicus franklandianus TaxID=1798806 RepID=A0A484IGA9_9ARCH|nr:hypothetical protein [Candidatus Nitrosocosmicus franklandus]VFJ15220.1 exported protein of unknown function [Candidatus Nitrosocosmicus franklandus]